MNCPGPFAPTGETGALGPYRKPFSAEYSAASTGAPTPSHNWPALRSHGANTAIAPIGARFVPGRIAGIDGNVTAPPPHAGPGAHAPLPVAPVAGAPNTDGRPAGAAGAGTDGTCSSTACTGFSTGAGGGSSTAAASAGRCGISASVARRRRVRHGLLRRRTHRLGQPRHQIGDLPVRGRGGGFGRCLERLDRLRHLFLDLIRDVRSLYQGTRRRGHRHNHRRRVN